MADISKFNIGKNFEIFILGDPGTANQLHRSLGALTFLNLQKTQEVLEKREYDHFVVALCDFTSERNSLVVSRAFARIKNHLAHKIIYATAPQQLQFEDFIFANEIGASYTAYGNEKEELLRNYLKKSAVKISNRSELEIIESQLKVANQKNDRTAIRKITQRLGSLGKDNPDVLRNLALANQYSQENKRSIYYLKSLLETNPQDIWATNQLLTDYSRINEASSGLETVEEITDFRIIETNTPDKIDTLKLLHNKPFSTTTLELLKNLAAVAISSNKHEDALSYLRLALRGLVGDQDFSKSTELYYQLGNIYMQLEDYESAVEHFEKALSINASYKKARYSLDHAKSLQKKKKSDQKNMSNINSISPSSNDTLTEDPSLHEIEIESNFENL